MNAQTVLPKLRAWFEGYVRKFFSDDPVVQESIDLKAEHTRRVCAAIVDIGGTLSVSAEDLCLAEVAGLLHDIGRFEQYRRYRTFSDDNSEDHAALGVKIINTHRILDGLEPSAADIIIRLVGYHNRAALPSGEGEVCLFFLKLLRDADKIDIWRVVTDYYQNAGKSRNRAIELNLPDRDVVSDSVYESLMKGEIAHMADLKTLNDFKLLQIGWIYDVHFPRTFQIVRGKRYLEMIRSALPRNSARVAEIYSRACAHLDRNSSANYPATPF